MSHGMITFRSVTYAQRGEDLLGRAGIRCTLRRTPHRMEARGCGYCLEMAGEDLLRGVTVLRENGVAFRRAYRREAGQWREVRV